MTSDQHAHANPQQVYDNLSNEIADILLGPDSPVRGNPEFDESIAEHDRLTKRQAELRSLDTKLVEVLPGLEQAEVRLTEAAKQLAAEKKKLAGFAGELGKAAFAGLRAGELPDHPLFADRKELQSRVESLQRQKAELVAGENAGMMEKAKVQAQQLKLTGQIKIEELKVGSLDRALGTALLTSKEKLSVQCGQSEEVLKAIADQRKQVAAAREQVKQAEVTLAGQKSATAETLERSTVNNADSLKSELKEVRKEHRQNEKAITSIRSSIVTTALEIESLRGDTALGEKLKQLWSLNFDLESSKTQVMKLVDESVSKFKGLPPKFKYSVYGVAGVMVLLLLMSFFGGDVYDAEVDTMDSGQDVSAVADVASKVMDTNPIDTEETELVRKLQPADASDHNGPAPETKNAASPAVAKWTKWPEPDEIVAEMGSLTMLQSTKPAIHRFTILKRLSEGVYEIQVELPLQSKGRAVLATNETKFKSNGQAYMPLTYSGVQPFTLANGFNQEFRLFREAAEFSTREAAQRKKAYWDEMRNLRRMLVCSSLHFNVPITNRWNDFHVTVGADKWNEMIADESQYLSRRAKGWFSGEVAGAYRETKESLESKFSPVHYAASVRALTLLDQLTRFGEDPSGFGDCGRPPLHIAIESYLRNREFKSDQDFDIAHLELILDRFKDLGVEADQKGAKARNLLHITGRQVSVDTIVEIANIRSTLRLLIRRGVDLGQSDTGGLTPLHLVILRSLARHGSEIPLDFHYRDLFGESPEDRQRSEVMGKILALFLGEGADVNAKDRFGNTALHMAAGCARVDIVKAILDSGGNRKLPNTAGDTPVDVLRNSFADVRRGTDLAYFRQALELLE
jgi:hypothetical protein